MTDERTVERLEKLARLATVRKEERDDDSRKNEASAAARAFFATLRDSGLQLRFESRSASSRAPRPNDDDQWWTWWNGPPPATTGSPPPPPASRTRGPTPGPARESGVCWICKHPFKAGDSVFWPSFKSATHEGCGPL